MSEPRWRYSIISAMDERELIEKVNIAVNTLGAILVGGVAARGAQLLQAVTLELSTPKPEPEDDDNGKPETETSTTVSRKRKGK